MSNYLISSVRVFDGSSVIYKSGYVHFANGILLGISAHRPADIPGDCIEISGEGCTLLPGLIDGHVHVYNQIYGLEESLKYGVTTVLDLHNETTWADDAKRTARERNDVADILSSYNSATIPNGWPRDVFAALDPSEGVCGLCSLALHARS
jgi:imidazolonepropionase-like amidohydrolase